MDFSVGDMRTYRQAEALDLVINLFTSFGYFEDQADDKLVMRNIFESLRPGGKLVVDVLGKEVLAASGDVHAVPQAILYGRVDKPCEGSRVRPGSCLRYRGPPALLPHPAVLSAGGARRFCMRRRSSCVARSRP